ncbi:uncharacterized protein LOC116214851 [Punica granatum]|nr:uncharacterized protein LOC116214851 [Punica granatum]
MTHRSLHLSLSLHFAVSDRGGRERELGFLCMVGAEEAAMDPKEPQPTIYEMEEASTPLYADRSCCFCFRSCFPSRARSSPLGPSFWERVGSGQHDDRWWARGLRALTKLREWSEIAAGPRWKTFIRRFNRTRSGCAGGGPRHGKFHYDAFNYSLNFDEGSNSIEFVEEEPDRHSFRNFSARFASVPGPVKQVPPVDISGKGKEVPVFG